MEKFKIAWCRVSTDKQTMDSQIMAIKEYLGDNPGKVEWVLEIASGKKANRAEYAKVMNWVKAGWVTEIICVRADRISRRSRYNLELADECKGRGTDIVGVSNGMRLLGPNGTLLFAILSALAEAERENISDRTKEGMAVARANGKAIGGMGGGYFSDRVMLIADVLRGYKRDGLSIYRVNQITGIDRKTLRRFFKEDAAGNVRSRQEVYLALPDEKKGKRWHQGV